MEVFLNPDAWIALLTLTFLEIVLGIDNIIFISILADRLPEKDRNKLRFWGIGLAMVMRLCLLALISYILKLDQTLFNIFDIDFTELWIMYTAVIVTVGIMLIAAKPISNFISKHPSFKILALSFLMMIGVSLIAEGLHVEIPKGYIYFSMAFAFFVDILQIKTIKNDK